MLGVASIDFIEKATDSQLGWQVSFLIDFFSVAMLVTEKTAHMLLTISPYTWVSVRPWRGARIEAVFFLLIYW